jgi:hypothetical protein
MKKEHPHKICTSENVLSQAEGLKAPVFQLSFQQMLLKVLLLL